MQEERPAIPRQSLCHEGPHQLLPESDCHSGKYRIALIFRGSLISRISQIWNRSRNLFNEDSSHCAVTPMGNMNSQNLFNEFLQNSYSRKFRPAKYKRYTVYTEFFSILSLIKLTKYPCPAVKLCKKQMTFVCLKFNCYNFFYK